MTVTIVYCFTDDNCLPEDFQKIRLTGQRIIKNEGAVQLCVRYGDTEDEYTYLWHYIKTQEGWTDNLRAANLCCKELGLNYAGKQQYCMATGTCKRCMAFVLLDNVIMQYTLTLVVIFAEQVSHRAQSD